MGRRRAAVVAAVALTAAVGVITFGAGQADAGRLPSGTKQAVGIDGQVVKLARSGESSRILPSMAANGAGRAAAVSGTYKASLSKGKGVLTVGYLVGCQINLNGLEGGLSATIATVPSVAGSITLPLTPGEVAFVKTDNIKITKGSATVMVDSFSIDVQKCGGYASARSVVQAVGADGFSTEDGALSGDGGYVQSTLYGRPFSLG